VCDLETSRIGAPYIYDISNLRVNPLWSRTLLLPTTVHTLQYVVTIIRVCFILLWGTYYLYLYVDATMGRDSSVGIATRYGLDGPGIESRWGTRLSAPVQTDPGAHPASYTMGTGSLLGVKRPKRGVDHPPASSAEVKENVELYLYSPFGPSWPVLGLTLPLRWCCPC